MMMQAVVKMAVGLTEARSAGLCGRVHVETAKERQGVEDSESDVDFEEDGDEEVG